MSMVFTIDNNIKLNSNYHNHNIAFLDFVFFITRELLLLFILLFYI